jgi:hypothetical protein
VAELQTALRALWPLGQELLASAELENALNGLKTLAARGASAEELTAEYARYAIPAVCDSDTLARLQEFTEQESDGLSTSVRRTLLEAIQGIERCLRSRRIEAEEADSSPDAA